MPTGLAYISQNNFQIPKLLAVEAGLPTFRHEAAP
jgi:hypothetical protein